MAVLFQAGLRLPVTLLDPASPALRSNLTLLGLSGLLSYPQGTLGAGGELDLSDPAQSGFNFFLGMI